MDDPTTTPSPTRTEAQVVHEMAELTAKITMLKLELKKLRNPTGKTMADLKGIWAGQDTSAEEIDAAKLRFRDDREPCA